MSARTGNRNWIWFFVVVAVLGAIAAAIPLIYNLRQQLQLSDLQAARALWQAKGPKSYILEYAQKGSAPGRFLVTVRDGRPEAVLMKSLEASDDPGRPLEPRLLAYHDMLGLFESIERNLELDAEKGAPRAFNVARFDPVDGHLLHYRRSVSATGQRLEILVTRLEPLAP